MLAGVIVIQDANCLGEINAGQFPDPNGPVAQEDDGFGFGDAAPQGFRSQESSKLAGANNVGDVSGRAIVPLGTLVGLVRFAVSEDRPDLDLTGVGFATTLAFASPQFLAAHGRTGAIGADAENVPRRRIEARRLGLPP